MLHKLNSPDELFAKTKVSLLHLISQYVEQHLERLPTEEELAKQLGVSRVLLRDVLAELQSRGYIARKRGKGTVINTQVCMAQPRIDEEISFVEHIRSKGMIPTVELLGECWTESAATGDWLNEDAELRRAEGEHFMMERLFLGSGKPLIHSTLLFRGKNISYDYRKWSGYGTLSPSEFLEIFCTEKPSVTLVELDLCQADARLAQLLAVSKGTHLFRIKDTRYSFDGRELVRGQAIFCTDILPMKLVQHGK